VTCFGLIEEDEEKDALPAPPRKRYDVIPASPVQPRYNGTLDEDLVDLPVLVLKWRTGTGRRVRVAKRRKDIQ